MVFSITDIIILIIIAISTLIGTIKGILSRFTKLINLIISAVIAFYVATPISSLFINLDFYKNLQERRKIYANYSLYKFKIIKMSY